ARRRVPRLAGRRGRGALRGARALLRGLPLAHRADELERGLVAVLSRGADTVRLGEDGVLRPLGPDELAPGFDRAGPTKLECAGWSVEQLEDEGCGERLEITDG